jgi:hypothetical protein
LRFYEHFLVFKKQLHNILKLLQNLNFSNLTTTHQIVKPAQLAKSNKIGAHLPLKPICLVALGQLSEDHLSRFSNNRGY